jgi:glycosyltransferase involved in cell wall biosynthesis
MDFGEITVYITCFNQEELIERAIMSVLNQTLHPKQIIVIDDASNDNSHTIIQKIASEFSCIKVLINKENVGISRVRNIALSLINTPYFTYLDGDDYFLPSKLEKEYNAMKKYEVDVVCSNFYFENPIISKRIKWIDDKIESEDILVLDRYNILLRLLPKNTLFRNELIKTELLNGLGGVNESLTLYEDYDFRIRYSRKARILCLKQPASVYSLNPDGLSSADLTHHYQNLKKIFVNTLAEEEQGSRQCYKDLVLYPLIYKIARYSKKKRNDYKILAQEIGIFNYRQKFSIIRSIIKSGLNR